MVSETIQQLKEDIAILQMKLKVLEEAEKQQPKTLFDAIRNLGYSVDACYEIIDAVEDFYETVDDEPSPQTPEEIEQSLKESFKEAKQTEMWKQTQKLIDEVDKNKNFKNSLESIKEYGEQNKPKTLYEICVDWCDDDLGPSVYILIDRISNWLPKEQTATGSQNSYVECAVNGWNDCLRTIKSKLR